jgi:hypothetical protein
VAVTKPKLPTARQLTAAVGSRFNAPAVGKLLAMFGFTTSLRAAIAEPDALVDSRITLAPNRRTIVLDFATRGIAFIFSVRDADDPNPPARVPPDARFELFSIQLTKPYAGELPERLSFANKLSGVRRKLKTAPAYRTRGWDVWGRTGYMISIRFGHTGAMQTMALFEN